MKIVKFIIVIVCILFNMVTINMAAINRSLFDASILILIIPNAILCTMAFLKLDDEKAN